MVGGFFSAQRNELAIPLGLWLRPEQLPLFTLAVLRHYERHGDRTTRQRSRVMYLIEALGLDAYRAEVLETLGALGGGTGEAVLHDGSHLVSIAPRDVCGVHPQKQPGLCWVGLNVPLGRLDSAAMYALVELAQGYGSGELRFSESQNILIVDVPTQRISALLEEPLLRRFPSDPGPLLAEAVSCTGNHYCGLALIPTKSTALAVLQELEQHLVFPDAVRTHWTGCPNACGQPYLGQIGLMGTKARKDGQMVAAVKIFLGGSMAEDPQLAVLHEKAVPLCDLPDVLETLLVERFGASRRNASA
jgi:ferredoxin-nitrite reductase